NGTGTIWTDIGASAIGNIVVDMMDVRTSDGFVAIGTHGSGMYSMFITDTITSSLATPDPYLSDVSTYPNPSSGGFTVKFTLESAQMMSIRLVDIRGSVVKLFEESRLGPGDHIRNYDATVAAGTYYLQLNGSVTGTHAEKVVIR
ncbi:MAG: T9SS type A sorting domain-containing protein, partial [Bacteroidota bacterium]